MAEEMKKTSNASSILANDTAPKSAKMMGAGAGKEKTASAAPKMEHEKHAAAGGRKHKHTHIEHHENGTHTVRHTPVGGGEDTSYAAQDLDGVHDGLEHHVGEPNGEEAQAQPQDGGGQPGADMSAGGGAAPAAGAQPQAGAQPMAV